MVSVIVPNYNHARYLPQRLESILGQTYQDFELILLDDGSTDGSRELLEAYRGHPRVSHVVCNEVNGGSAFRQWDKGLALARGEWVWIAESDDWADPTFLERLLTTAEAEEDSVLAYCVSQCVDEQGRELWEVPADGRVTCYRGEDFIRQKLLYSNVVVNVSGCLMRRSACLAAERHRYEGMRLCGDWMFYVLLAGQGRVVAIGEPLNHCRRHGTNIAERAEKEGLTLLEGADILEYIIQRYGVKARDYAHAWGRTWHKYHRRYGFAPAVERAVWRRYLWRHPMVVAYRVLYLIGR